MCCGIKGNILLLSILNLFLTICVAELRLKRIIRELKGKGKTVIISSHLINTLHELCDEIDFLDNHTIRKRYIQVSIDEIEQDILESNNYIEKIH